MQQEQNNVSCLNSRAIVDYIRRKHPDSLPDLLEAVPSPWRERDNMEAWLCDENNWIPSGLVVSLFQAAREVTGSPTTAFDIGFQSILTREFSYWQKLFVHFFSSPRLILRRVNQLNARLNSTKVVELVSDSAGHAHVRWHWSPGAVSSKDICLYNQGIYSAIPTIWGQAPAKVVEHGCHFEGRDHCEVHLTWSPSLKRLGGFFSRVFPAGATVDAALEEIDRDKRLLKERFDELARVNGELSKKVTVLNEINKAARVLASLSDTQEVLAQTMRPLVEVFGFDRAMIMLVDDTGGYLEYRFGVGESPERIAKLRGYRIPLAHDQNLLVQVLNGKKPATIRDVEAAGLNPTNRILADFRPSSFVVCPLVSEDEAIGVLGADRRGDDAQVSEADAELLSIFAYNIATAFLHARLDEELKSSNVSSVRALVQAIEEKDPYTRGHSERVAAYSSSIARILGFSSAQIEYLHFAAILHDVGKIGIPESIIHTPRPLTPEEFSIIKEHPMKGVHILRHISLIRDHMHIIRNHHERWDGSGYPDRLAGDAIHLEAQIVSVADAYDAMTSTRPYRAGMSHARAAGEIHAACGTQFSTRMVDAFMEFYDNRTRALSEVEGSRAG